MTSGQHFIARPRPSDAARARPCHRPCQKLWNIRRLSEIVRRREAFVMTDRIRWGIIGPGTIAANFAQGLAESDSGVLHAIASRSADRRRDFGDRFGVAEARRYDDYAALCADPEVDAVHVATPHPFHADQALMAIRAAKALSVE